MTVATIEGLKSQLAYTADIGSAEDTLLQSLIDAALSYVEAVLGFQIEDNFGGTGQDPVPSALSQAVLQLAGHWWEVRGHDEAAALMKAAPIWVEKLIQEFREWSF